MKATNRDSLSRSIAAITRGLVGIFFGKVVTVDAAKHVADVMPEMEEGQVWTDVPYQPLIGKSEGEWHDPVVGAAVVILQDGLGRRRIIGPPEQFVQWHVVSKDARVRLDLTRDQFQVTIEGGVTVDINGSEVLVDGAAKVQINSGEVHVDNASLVQINGGSHPAMRGDIFQAWYATVKLWNDLHVHTGPSGPPAAQSPTFDDGVLDPTVLLD